MTPFAAKVAAIEALGVDGLVCLSFDAVSVVIPGMRRVPHVNYNVRAADGNYFDGSELAEIAKHRWIRDFYL